MIWKHRKHYFEVQEDVNEIPICYKLVRVGYFTSFPLDYPTYTVTWRECETNAKGYAVRVPGEILSVNTCILLSSLGGTSTLNRYASMPTESQVMDAITNNSGQITVPIYDTITNTVVGSLLLTFNNCT